MRAKTIYETQHFERGLEPKRAMETGIDVSKIARDFLNNEGNTNDIAQKYFGSRKEEGKATILEETMRYIFAYKRKPQSAFLHACYIVKFNSASPIDVEYRKEVAKVLWDEFKISVNPIIHESQNFTRGLDPKAAMDVGQKTLDRKLIEETDWGIDHKTIKNIYDIVEIIRDYRGLPILILKEKGEKSWPYRGVSKRTPLADRIHEKGGHLIGDFCDTAEQALREIKNDIDKRLDNNYVRESHNFTRGLDPKDALEIGDIVTRKRILINKLRKFDAMLILDMWNDKEWGKESKGKYWLLTVTTKVGQYKWDTNRMLNADISTLKELLEMLQNYTPTKDYWKTKQMYEVQNFERGLDPKVAMGTGLQSQILQGMQDIRTAPHVGSINLYNTHLEIYFMENKPFKDTLYKYFDKDLFSDVYLFKNPKGTWIYVYNVIIKPQYKDYFRNCFDKEGIIKDNI